MYFLNLSIIEMLTDSCAGMHVSEEVVRATAQWKRARKGDHQKRKGKKPQVEASSRQAPMAGERSDSPVFIISPMRETEQAEANEAIA